MYVLGALAAAILIATGVLVATTSNGQEQLSIGASKDFALAQFTGRYGPPCVVGKVPNGFARTTSDTYALWELSAKQNDVPGPFILIFGTKSVPGYWPRFSGKAPRYVDGLYGPQDTPRNWCSTGLIRADVRYSQGEWSPA
jgi:hypothetical protein